MESRDGFQAVRTDHEPERGASLREQSNALCSESRFMESSTIPERRIDAMSRSRPREEADFSDVLASASSPRRLRELLSAASKF